MIAEPIAMPIMAPSGRPRFAGAVPETGLGTHGYVRVSIHYEGKPGDVLVVLAFSLTDGRREDTCRAARGLNRSGRRRWSHTRWCRRNSSIPIEWWSIRGYIRLAVRRCRRLTICWCVLLTIRRRRVLLPIRLLTIGRRRILLPIC